MPLPARDATLLGFRRPNGSVGVRNCVAVIPSVFCANGVAQRIAWSHEESVALCHPLGCSQVGLDLELTARTLKGLGRNPNVAAVLVVGLGCERLSARELVDDIALTGKPVEWLSIQQEGGTTAALDKGRRLLAELVASVSGSVREPCSLRELTVAVECGGSDGSSLIAANPSIGAAMDLLVDHGATVVFSEVTELQGIDAAIVQRAVSLQVADKARALLERTRVDLVRRRDEVDGKRSALISRGNIEGGLTTLTEKSFGGLVKSGTRPISAVVDYAEQVPLGPGVVLMDAPGHDAESVTGMVAGGAQVVVFSTGRGSPAGFPTAPVIKVTGNPETYARMRENIDLDASPALDGTMHPREMGDHIFRLILEVSSGQQTAAETLGHHELLAIWRAP